MAPSGVRAQENAQRTAAARLLFAEGVELVAGEQWEEAADHFRRSLALRPSPVVAYNLASALVRLTRLVEASELLRSVARNEEAPVQARRAAEQLLEQVEPRLGRLTVRLAGDPRDTQLLLDERELSTEMVGVAIPVDPGTHHIAVRRGDAMVAEGQVNVAEGAAAEISLDVPQLPAPLEGEEGFRPGSELLGEGSVFEPGAALAQDLPEARPADEGQTEPPTAPDPGETARAAQGQGAAHIAPDEDDSILTNGWFWGGVGAGVLAAVATVAAIVIAGADRTPPAVGGNLEPAVIEVGR